MYIPVQNSRFYPSPPPQRVLPMQPPIRHVNQPLAYMPQQQFFSSYTLPKPAVQPKTLVCMPPRQQQVLYYTQPQVQYSSLNASFYQPPFVFPSPTKIVPPQNKQQLQKSKPSPTKPENNQKKPSQIEPSNEEVKPLKVELEELALQYEDGFIYRGQGYPPHNRHGFGVLSDPQDNEVYSGFWKNNVYDGNGRLINVDEADDHEIDWHNLAEIGHAWHKYEGEFVDGKKNGKGKLYFKSNMLYDGEFHDDQINGEGVFHSNQGDIIEGTWEQGHLVSFKKKNQ